MASKKSEDTAPEPESTDDRNRQSQIEERRLRREQATTVDGSETPSETESKESKD